MPPWLLRLKKYILLLNGSNMQDIKICDVAVSLIKVDNFGHHSYPFASLVEDLICEREQGNFSVSLLDHTLHFE